MFSNDKKYIKERWDLFNENSYSLNLDNPITFNDKMNWLKLNYHPTLLSVLGDKFKVKDYIANKIGEQFVVPCYGVWDNFDSIDFNLLPSQFVLKATHDSSGVVIVKDKTKINNVDLREHFNRLLKRNWYYYNREWVYKEIKPRIIAEKYLDDHSGHELRDYKWWCFNGNPTFMYITNKGEIIYENFYDMEFSPVMINHGFPRRYPEYSCPEGFEIMKRLAKQLSEGLPFVRVDFFVVDGKVYFGEYTFYDWAGLKPFCDYDQDLFLGSFLDLSEFIGNNE